MQSRARSVIRTSAATERTLAARRASLRKDSAGAALFVVAITLALLAAMGVYGLSATALDVRSAGHGREAMTGQSVATHSFMLTSETMSPGAAQGIINTMYAGTSGPTKQSTNCRTAKPYTGLHQFCDAEACVLLTPTELYNVARNINTTAVLSTHFQPEPFGPGYPVRLNAPAVHNSPDIEIEVTSPVITPAPAGFESADPNNPKVFVEATVTVFTELRPTDSSPPDINVVGRGRIIVGPMSKPPCVRP